MVSVPDAHASAASAESKASAAPAAGILEFKPAVVLIRRVSAGSGTNGHTAVVALRGRTPGERGWFDRN